METKPDSRMERKKEETHNRIITAAVALFNQRGLEAVTMEQIAEAADIAKGTLYNYFPAKEAIISAYLQRSFAERNDDRLARLRQLPDTRARLTHVFRFLLAGVQAQKEVFEAFMVYRMKQVISFRPIPEGEQTGLTGLAREIISLGQQSGELRTDLPAKLLEELFEFTLIETIKPFFLQPEDFDLEKSVANCVDLFINGAKA